LEKCKEPFGLWLWRRASLTEALEKVELIHRHRYGKCLNSAKLHALEAGLKLNMINTARSHGRKTS